MTASNKIKVYYMSFQSCRACQYVGLDNAGFLFSVCGAARELKSPKGDGGRVHLLVFVYLLISCLHHSTGSKQLCQSLCWEKQNSFGEKSKYASFSIFCHYNFEFCTDFARLAELTQNSKLWQQLMLHDMYHPNQKRIFSQTGLQ